MKIYKLNTILTFGMHSGKTIQEIIEYTGVEDFDFPELKNKPKSQLKNRNKEGKLIKSTPEEIKQMLNGYSLRVNPDGNQYINWCIINLENFYIRETTMHQIILQYLNFELSDEAYKQLIIKSKKLLGRNEWNKFHYFDFFGDDGT